MFLDGVLFNWIVQLVIVACTSGVYGLLVAPLSAGAKKREITTITLTSHTSMKQQLETIRINSGDGVDSVGIGVLVLFSLLIVVSFLWTMQTYGMIWGVVCAITISGLFIGISPYKHQWQYLTTHALFMTSLGILVVLMNDVAPLVYTDGSTPGAIVGILFYLCASIAGTRTTNNLLNAYRMMKRKTKASSFP